jgi:hypothetical protein
MSRHTRNPSGAILRIFGMTAVCACLAALAFALPQDNETTSQAPEAVTNASAPKPDQISGVIDYRIRDSETGYAIQATIKYADVEEGWGNPRSATTDDYGHIQLSLPPANYLIEISAPGYPARRTHDKIGAGTHSAAQIVMVPQSPPEELRPEVMESKLFKGYGLWQGYVVDAVTFKPLAGARVSLEKAQLETRTNERGYFSISAPVVDPKGPFPGPPVMDTMIIELVGYKTHIEKNEPVPNEGGVIDFSGVDLEPGQGTTIHDNTPAPLREDYGHHQSAEPSRPPEDPRVLKWLSEQPGKGLALGTGTSLETVPPVAAAISALETQKLW